MMQPAQDEEKDEEEGRTLWIGDLQHWMDEAYIDSCFAHTGEVFTTKVIRNAAGKSSSDECYYGFIEFKSHAIAESFLHKFNGTLMPLGTTNFSLDWASSFGQQLRQEEEEEEEEDDDDGDLAAAAAAAAASDLVTTDFMLPQETFTHVKHLDCDTQIYNEKTSSWEDMLKWWRIAQETPTTPEAVGAILKVYGIGAFLKRSYRNCLEEIAPAELEEMLDELRLVESIDIAKELHSMEALHPLIGKLDSRYDGIRANAAKIIKIMAEKYPSSRHLVMEADGDEMHLCHFSIGNCGPTVQTIGLDVMSSLFLNEGQGFSLFRQKRYAELIPVLKYDIGPYQRNVLNLIEHLVKKHNSDCNIVTALGLHSLVIRLLSSVHAESREAALSCLTVLAEAEKFENNGQLVIVNNDELAQVLQEGMKIFGLMSPEDLRSASNEKRLLDSLWNACYDNKPTFL